MQTRYILQTAFSGLRRNTLRSGLTILGIVIGVAAIILVVSVGKGAQELVLRQIRGLGSRTIIVEPGREPEGPSSLAEIFTDSLRERDVAALQKPANVRGVKRLTPAVFQVATVSSQNESIRTNVLGAAEAIQNIIGISAQEGRFFSADEVRQKSSVAVLGSEVTEKLFGASRAVGEMIKIKGRTFRVIGIVAPKGRVGVLDVDNIVAVPYTTSQQYLLGITHFNSIIVEAESEEVVTDVVQDIKIVLRSLHGISDPDKDDFHVTTQADIVERVGTVASILTILLVSIAAISLVVGGIGIMNIMLVSITERTREIGLRKAVGATNRDILVQFLLEAMLLTVTGGVIGIVLGAGLAWITSLVLGRITGFDWVFTLPLSAVLLGVSVASVVGLIFGLYPARQASLKNPIEALRYE